VEILEEPKLPDPPRNDFDPIAPRREHALPTHWFLHALPRLGRTTFLVYLYLLRSEAADVAAVHPVRLAEVLKLRSARHSLWHFRRLRRHGFLRRHRHARGLTILDPPPPTRRQRVVVRLVTLGLWPRLRGEALLYLVLLLLLLGTMYFLSSR
jgi:hypothetical protein